MTKTPVAAEFLDRLRAFVRRRVRSDEDADDIIQDVLLKLVRQGEALRGSAHAWLYSVARNAIIDRARARKRMMPLDQAAEPSVVEEPGSTTTELARCLEPMLRLMRKEDRAILIRADRDGEAQADLARELRLPVSTVKTRIQRARARLRRQLENCCSIELDARGHPVQYRRRKGRGCPCDIDC